MRKTRLMSKLFSSDTTDEYKEKVLTKMDEAHENGSATLDEDGEKLQFADVDGDIIVEDQTDGMNEVTRISQNPENENDFIMSEVEVPEDDMNDPKEEVVNDPVVEETVTESDNLESIEIKRVPGPDGEWADDLVEDLDIEVDTGINDDDKSGTNAYSFKFKNFSKKKAQIIAKIFAHCADCIGDVVKSADVDEDVQVSFENGKMKVMSVAFGTPSRTFSVEGDQDEDTTDLTEVIDAANELSEDAEDINKDNAQEIMEKAESIIEACEDCEEDRGFSLKSIKVLAKCFADTAAQVLDEEQVDDEGYAGDEGNETETSEEEVVEDTVTESNANPQVLQCPETGKWYIQEDPEKKLYDTQEEAEQVAARAFCGGKSFSEPKVTVTIEDLEPASVSDLLGGPKSESKDEDVEPAVDPNEGATGRQFSITGTGKSNKYNNPLLFSEIN